MILDHEALGHRSEVLFEVRERNVEALQIPFQPGQEQVSVTVNVIVCVQKAAVMRDQEEKPCIAPGYDADSSFIEGLPKR